MAFIQGLIYLKYRVEYTVLIWMSINQEELIG